MNYIYLITWPGEDEVPRTRWLRDDGLWDWLGTPQDAEATGEPVSWGPGLHSPDDWPHWRVEPLIVAAAIFRSEEGREPTRYILADGSMVYIYSDGSLYFVQRKDTPEKTAAWCETINLQVTWLFEDEG